MNRTSLNIHTQIRITRTVVSRRDEEFVCRRKASSPLTSHTRVSLTETKAKKTGSQMQGCKGLFAQTIYSAKWTCKGEGLFFKTRGKKFQMIFSSKKKFFKCNIEAKRQRCSFRVFI